MVLLVESTWRSGGDEKLAFDRRRNRLLERRDTPNADIESEAFTNGNCIEEEQAALEERDPGSDHECRRGGPVEEAGQDGDGDPRRGRPSRIEEDGHLRVAGICKVHGREEAGASRA